MAVLRTDGTFPDCSEWFIAVVIRGLMAWICSLTRAVGKGSRVQVEGFIRPMVSSTSCCVVGEKQRSGWGATSCRSTAEAVGIGGPEREERMVSTFVLKNVRKSLHCSGVVALFVGVCGFRK